MLQSLFRFLTTVISHFPISPSPHLPISPSPLSPLLPKLKAEFK
ncbi:MAG: hypothetical protein RMY29_002315 [Nostoc sp. CreGUA01]|nr:hypothetical protein [Nostoc sp. CreGUA01]